VREPRWVPRLVVEAIHFDQLQSHGGAPGLRDEGALEAALARPRHRRAFRPRADLASLAAAYAHGLARGHPFHDGNKRTAFLVMVVFLETNGRRFRAPEAEVVKTMLEAASGSLSEAALARWIRRRIAPRPAGGARTTRGGTK